MLAPGSQLNLGSTHKTTQRQLELESRLPELWAERSPHSSTETPPIHTVGSCRLKLKFEEELTACPTLFRCDFEDFAAGIARPCDNYGAIRCSNV